MTTTKALAVVDRIIYASHKQVKVMMPYLFITHTGCCLGHLCYAVRGGAFCFCAGLLSTTNSQVLCHLPWAQRGQGRGDPSNEIYALRVQLKVAVCWRVCRHRQNAGALCARTRIG
eukprot:scaffold66826_cov60-Cyclotella_meneghiniana.AAC.3